MPVILSRETTMNKTIFDHSLGRGFSKDQEFYQSLSWIAQAVYDEALNIVNMGGWLSVAISYLSPDLAEAFWSGFHDKPIVLNNDPRHQELFMVGSEIGYMVDQLEAR